MAFAPAAVGRAGPAGGDREQGRCLWRNRAGSRRAIRARWLYVRHDAGRVANHTTPVVSPTIVPQARKVSFDPFKDLTPVSRVADYTVILTAHPSIGVTTVQELAALSIPQTVLQGRYNAHAGQHSACRTSCQSGGLPSTGRSALSVCTYR